MRRILLALTLLIVATLCGGVAVLYVMHDQLFLREARIQAAKLAPLHVEIGTLHTSLFGTFSAELGDLELHQDKGTVVKIHDLRVTSSLGLLGLYRSWSAKDEIPLSVTVKGMKVSQSPAPPSALILAPEPPSRLQAWPQSLPFPAASPIPLHLDLRVQNAELSGPVNLKDLNLHVEARTRSTGMEATINVGFSAGPAGSDALLPVSLDTKIAASSETVKIQSFLFKAAGMEGTGNGELGLSPVKGKFKLALDAPELARLILRAEDKAAIGLTAQPSGAIALKMEGEADEMGLITTVGILRMQNLLLPLRAGAGSGRIDGPVSLHAEVPFRLKMAWQAAIEPTSLFVQKALVGFDLTQASVVSTGKLEKARGVPFRGEVTVSSSESGVELTGLTFALHTFSVSGNASLPAPIGSAISSAFRAQISSLAGFLGILPMLRAADSQGAEISEAQGSVQAEGNVHIVREAMGQSLVDLRTFNVKGLRLPLAYAGDNMVLRGLVTGGASGGGRFNAGDVSISETKGAFDLTGLEIAIPGKFAKKKGKKLTFAFDAKGTPAKLQIRSASVAADGLSASLSGTAAFDSKRNATLALNTVSHAELAALRDYLPKLPMKISGGVFDSSLKIGGTWMPLGGIEKSPLLLSGKVGGRITALTMPEAAPGAAPSAAPAAPTPLLPPWPAVRNSNLTFRFDVAQFQRGALVASGIAAAGALNKGTFTAAASVAKVFGGKAVLKNLSGNLLLPQLAVRGAASVEGIDLAQAAAFVDPSYGKIVKGSLKADSNFSVPDSWGDVLNTANASGTAQIHKGYLSTASFDGLVNEKLKSVPGVGDKAKVSTGGLDAEIKTAFSVANGTATLTGFDAATPKNDEMLLNGTMNLAFDCDLTGTAHLASAPVYGAVREANSDPQGRLVVPVRFSGNLKSPRADVATGAIEEMMKKTAAHELDKKKNQLVDDAKKKAQNELQDAAGGLLDQFKKNLKK